MTAKARRRRRIVRGIEEALYGMAAVLVMMLILALPELVCRLVGCG